jgi:hypothetical protein
MRKEFVDIRTALSCATNLLLAWHLSIEQLNMLAGWQAQCILLAAQVLRQQVWVWTQLSTLPLACLMYTACHSGVEAAGIGVDTNKHAATIMLNVYCLLLRC